MYDFSKMLLCKNAITSVIYLFTDVTTTDFYYFNNSVIWYVASFTVLISASFDRDAI